MKQITILAFLGLFLFGCVHQEKEFKIELSATDGLMTQTIQYAIDKCTQVGGGEVFFKKGTYLTGGLHLKGNVTLNFEDGTILQGSDNCADYGDCKWTDALIHAEGVKNIKIIGEATLDGVDCKNPNGEEGFRGPHCIRMVDCDSIEIRGITIVRSANWAQNFRNCSNGLVENVTVRGGHDAFHTRWCKNFVVRDCDFRTGDDCFAGNDNHNFLIENCKANTSCNAFRFGCDSLVIRDVYIWGPGEYIHRVSGRNNTISAFTHFSPTGEKPEAKNGNWFVENLTVEGVDNLFIYNYDFGLWQTGQPATNFVFDNLQAKNILKSFTIIGDTERQFQLTIKNSVIEENDTSNLSSAKIGGRETPMPAFFSAQHFNKIVLDNVVVKINGNKPAFQIKYGDKFEINGKKYTGDDQERVVVDAL